MKSLWTRLSRELPGLLAGVILLVAGLESGAAPTTATTAWRPPDPLELKDQEIGLLKQQLAQARQQQERDRVGRIVFETQLRVAALHGFQVTGVVEFAPLTGAVVDRLVTESFKNQYPGQAMADFIWLNQLFAALPQPFDMPDAIRKLMGEQAAGIYDPHSKQLFVKTDFPLESPLGMIILSHEICHALQDQNFSLIEMGAEDADDSDRALATLALAEGDATLLMGEYFARHGNAADIFRFLPSLLSMDQQKLQAAPPSIQETLLFPYLKGMRFFQTLGGRTRKRPHGPRNVAESAWRNEVFRDPPATTQQILHPELYLANKLPARVAAPKLDQAGPVTVNVAGEFGTALLLESLLGAERADTLAIGWNGDKLAVAQTRDGARRLVGWATRWDTPQAADAFAKGLEEFFTARFAGELDWRGNRAERRGTHRTGQLTIRHVDANGIELRGSFEKKAAFPKVKIRPARPALP